MVRWPDNTLSRFPWGNIERFWAHGGAGWFGYFTFELEL